MNAVTSTDNGYMTHKYEYPDGDVQWVVATIFDHVLLRFSMIEDPATPDTHKIAAGLNGTSMFAYETEEEANDAAALLNAMEEI